MLSGNNLLPCARDTRQILPGRRFPRRNDNPLRGILPDYPMDRGLAAIVHGCKSLMPLRLEDIRKHFWWHVFITLIVDDSHGCILSFEICKIVHWMVQFIACHYVKNIKLIMLLVVQRPNATNSTLPISVFPAI